MEEVDEEEECSERMKKMSLLWSGARVPLGRLRPSMSTIPGEKCWMVRVWGVGS